MSGVRALGQDQKWLYMKIYQFVENFLYFENYYMHGYDVNEAHYLNCEIMAPWSWVFKVLEWGHYGHIVN